MRVIGMLLGIPDEDQQTIRDHVDSGLRTEPGKPMRFSEEPGGALPPHRDLRGLHRLGERNPSDDVMTALLTAEFEDEQGVTRRLTRRDPALHQRRRRRRQRDHEPADRLGGKVLAEHPDQRRELAEDRSLVNGAIEELLRFESPGRSSPGTWRDVELHGQTVPRQCHPVPGRCGEPRRATLPRRRPVRHPPLAGPASHSGTASTTAWVLRSPASRIVVEEVLQRFPTWDVDLDNARMASTSTVRGWESLPVFTP